MSKVSPKRRRFQIKKRSKRRKKLKELKEKYFTVKKKGEKEKILQKIKKVAPYLSLEDLSKEE
jgi:hypothetical protein